MKKRFLMIISMLLVVLFAFSACNKILQNTEETTGATDDEVTEGNSDVALVINGIGADKYTVVYDARASVGSEAAYKYFKTKMTQTYKMELAASTRMEDGYQITVGVAGNDSGISQFYSSCEEGMIGFDGKNIYLLAKHNSGLYSVIDAFFAKATENGLQSMINVSENEKVAITKDSIRVMSYNVLYDLSGRDMAELADFVKSQNADVFGTQETQDEQKEAILAAMPNYDCYAGVKLKGGANMQNIIFWNADKFKAVGKGFQYLTDTPFIESKIPESNSYRGFSYVVLESLETQKQFLFINVHLTYRDSNDETSIDSVRYKQAQYLKKFIESKKYEGMPMVLVGDFNSVPSSQTLTLMEDTKRMDRTAWIAKTKGDLEGTIAVSERTKRDRKYAFDHIFVTSDRIAASYFTAVDKTINGKYPSDHLPVIADIVIY